MNIKERALPASQEERTKILRSYGRKSTVYTVAFYLSVALAAAGFLGAIVAVIVFEFTANVSETLFFILLGSFLGGGTLAGGAAYLFSRLLAGNDLARADFAERCSSEHSFYVGEGTLATFEKDLLRLHGDGGQGKTIRIPYGEIRLFSVCTRRAPREKGEWSVVLELPARYLAKDGKGGADEKVLVETDAKERLFKTIKERGLLLLGEEKKTTKNARYRLKTKFFVPMAEKRRRAMLTAVLGAVVAGAGIPVAIFWNVTAGSFLSVIGFFLAARSVSAFLGAKSVFSVYEEGIFWKEASGERIFLKWEEIESVSRTEIEGRPVLKLQCVYGAYHIPDIAGAYECVKALHPEK